MNFRHPIPRSGKPIKRSPIKKKARSKAERLRIYGPPGYVEWCRKQRCIACGGIGNSEVAHIKTGGMGRKDDWTRTVPLCSFDSAHGTYGCHRSLHNLGRATFEMRNGIDLESEAKRIQELWDTETT